MSHRPQLQAFFTAFLPLARANQVWFHAAHHITRGTGFAGDHVKIYKKIYKAYDDVYDRVAEKAVGMTHESVACPVIALPAAAQIVTKYSQPCKISALQIAQQGLAIERNFLGFIENSLKNLRASGELTAGIENMLGGFSDEHETFAYFLGQRVKTDLAQ
jgi:DNA-binding ferritin-like protein